MIKNLKTKFLLGITFLFASTGTALAQTTSRIVYVQANPGTSNRENIFYIKLENPPTQAGCASDAEDRMVAPLNTERGRAAFEIAISAKANNRPIVIGGAGNCTDRYENIGYIRHL